MMKTETDQTKIALIQKDLENIKISQDRMEIKVDALQGIFWTTKGHEEFVVDTNKRFIAIENSNNLWKWLSPILTGLLTAAITFLFINYLQHLK